MKRPLMTFVGAFVLGEVLGLCQLVEVKWGILYALIVLIPAFIPYKYFGKGRLNFHKGSEPSGSKLTFGGGLPARKMTSIYIWMLLPIFLLLGIVRGEQTPSAISPTLLSKYLTVKGEVYWMEEKNNSYLIYLKHISNVSENPKFQDSRIILYLNEDPDFKLGNVIMASGSLESFPEARNPGQFDSAFYYRTLKINGRIFANNWEVISHKQNFYSQWLYTLRQRLSGILQRIGKDQDPSIYGAILLGDRSQLDDQLKELYQRNGIIHILSISGQHISILGMGVYMILRNRGQSYVFSGIVSCWLMVSYGIMAGGGSSLTRALIMFGLHLLSNVLGRTYDMNTAISVAAGLIFYDNPLLLLSSGAQLSFSAVLGISLVFPIFTNFLKTENKIYQSLLVCLSIQITTLPICIYHYLEYPRYALIINLFILPLMSLVVYSGTFGILFGLVSLTIGSFSIGIGHYILRFYNFICNIFETLPYSMNIVGRPRLWQVCFYYGVVIFLLILCFCLSKKEKKRNSIYFIFFLVAFVYIGLIETIRPIGSNKLEITILDVGQGDGIFIKVPDGGTYLIDGGSLDVKEMGKYRLEPFLKYYGISTIDYGIITHGDRDHFSGILELMENQSSSRIQIKNLIISKFMEGSEEGTELVLKANKLNIPIFFMEEGTKLEDGEMVLSCIYPAKDYRPSSVNDSSIVLTLEYQGFRGLFTGDLEAPGENWILENVPLKAYTLLKVGHHGSKTSSSRSFIEAVHPNIAIISCGIDNQFGHPHPDVTERLEAIGSHIYQTSKSGAITVSINGGYWEVRGFLENHK